MSADPFGTAAIRARVLDAWSAAPVRFREDANAEEDLVRGGYRDRVVVELAQNASDAAAAAGVAGRLSLRLVHGVLLASNTGQPLDAAGVESLSTLRASSKRAVATAGRFGVGFAAVLAVSDEPAIGSGTGAVRWSADEARSLVSSLAELQPEIARRDGQVPVLRLPLPADAEPEAGYDTTVTLPLRDDAAAALVRRLLDEVDDALLLALPDLEEIVVEVDDVRRTVAGRDRWHVLRRSGPLQPALLDDRPVEERERPWWSLTWALPLAGQAVPDTVYAPTPTDEALGLGALLIASFPLEPTRRRVAPGPLTDFIVERAADAFGALATAAADPVSVIPDPVAVGALDSSLRRAVVEALAETPFLRTDDGVRVRPRDAVSVVGADAEVREVLAEVLPGLVPDHRVLDRVGVRRLRLPDVVDLLAELAREPAWWRQLYDALALAPTPEVRESLGALPVPLQDGRLVRGPRGLLVAEDPLPSGLVALGLRVVHPEAAHPLLLRLGAVTATARSVLDDPAVRAAVEATADEADPTTTVDAVLALVAAAATAHGEIPWLADLVLLDDLGDRAPASDLALPDSFVADVSEPEVLGRPAPELVERWGAEVLAAVGVLRDFGVRQDHDVALDELSGLDLPDADGWLELVEELLPAGTTQSFLPELAAVRDLDVVRDDAWPRVLAALADDPAARRAVVESTYVVGPAGTRATVPSYTAWWLGEHARLDGRPLTSYALAGDLTDLYDHLDTDLDETFLAAIGVRTTLAALLAEPGGPEELLDRLADPARQVGDATLTSAYVALAAVDADHVSPRLRVRVRESTVVDVAEALVLDSPAHLQLSWRVPPILMPLAFADRLADVLDIDTTSTRLGGVDVAAGAERPLPDVVRRVLTDPAETWHEHDELTVAGQHVEWWLDAVGRVHASTLHGLARGLALAAGQWERRLLVAEVLADPDRVDELVAEASLDDPLR